MTPAIYRPHRLPHGVLRALADGPLTFAQLADGFDTGWPRAKLRSKLQMILEALKRDGFVNRAWLVELTEDGREALEDLDAGRCVSTAPPQTSVRIFARAA